MSRIIVIDDDSALRLDISNVLRDWGHEVIVAKNAKEGLERIEEWEPDLVLCDIQMPTGTGYDLFYQIIERDDRSVEMAFIFISSLSERSMVIKGIEIGADDYIVKPIDYGLLKVKVDSHCRRIRNVQNYQGDRGIFTEIKTGAAAALMCVSIGGIAGIAVFTLVYWFKTALGINIFEDVHLKDFF